MYVILLIIYGSILSTHSLHETIICDYYNETICKRPSAKCDTEQVDSCDEYNGTKSCFVVWGNNTQGSVTVKFKGCFPGDKSCGGGELCVHSGKFKADKFFCCCNGNMCNKDFYWNPTPEPPSEPDNNEIIPKNVDVIALMVLLPVMIICIITISLVYKRQKHLYSKQLATSDVEVDYVPSAEDESLGPINLKELKAKGRFGCVWKAEYKGELVAVKIFSFQHKQSWSTELEIYKLSLINHENILNFIGVEKREDELEYWLVTSYHENGSLYDYLKTNIITWEQLCHIGYSMMKGLTHLHEEIRSRKDGIYKPAIAHRDFKSSNVLLKNDLTACIADFGLAVIFRQGHADDRGHAQVGTARYMAPEVLAGAVNITKNSFLRIDMYSCGLVLWELLSRCSAHGDCLSEYQLPFEKELGQHPSLSDLQDLVVHNKRRPILKDTWKSHVGLSSLCDTIEECWDEDIDSRLSAPCVMERIAWYIRPSVTPAKPPVFINNLSEG